MPKKKTVSKKRTVTKSRTTVGKSNTKKSVPKQRRAGRGKKKDSRLKKAGVSGYNKPKRTPGHKTKSHIVVAKEGGKVKTIRFGSQGVSGSPKKVGESAKYRARRLAWKARHAKNIARGKMSAAYWANKVKW